MATHTKIIEFYGLPGCGKTTLRNNLVANSEGLNFALMTEITQKYKSLPFFKKVYNIPYVAWWRVFLFIISMPLLPIRDWRFYEALFEFVLVYSYATHVSGVDYVVVDHGIIQGVVSLMNGHSIRLTNRQLERLGYVVLTIPDCIYAYCQISVERSLERIRRRGRDHGRLDILGDDYELSDQLKKEDIIFNQLSEFLCSIKGVSNVEIDSLKSPEVCVSTIRMMIGMKQ